MNMPRVILAFSIAVVGLVVLLVTRLGSSRRVFLLDLGRELEPSDRARAKRTSVVAVLTTGIGIATALFAPSLELLALAATLLPLVSVLWMLVEIALLMRKLPAPPAPSRFAVPLGKSPSISHYVSAPLEIMNFAVVVLCAATFGAIRAELPAIVPLHYDAAGHPNRWGSPSELWTFVGLMVFLLLLSWGIAASVAKERWALPKDHAERFGELQVRRRSLIVRMVEVLTLGVNLSIASAWLGTALGSLPGRSGLVAIGALTSLVLSGLAVVGPLVAFIRPLIRVQDELKRLGGSVALGTHASGWRWGGAVYYAPEDPALFVPKQRGIGQTLNFARPSAWILLIVVLAAPLGIAAASMAFSK